MVAKKTHEEFLVQLSRINSSVKPVEEYRGTDTPIMFRCEVCGNEWHARPANLLRGKACPRCSAEKVGMGRRLTHEQFADRVRSFHPEIELLGVYTKGSEPIDCRCGKCGTKWSPKAVYLGKGSGCPKCADESRIVKRSRSHGDFLKEMRGLNPAIEILGTYVNNHTPLECRCLVCGNVWAVRPANLLNGTGCPDCRRRLACDKHRRSQEEFEIELAAVNPDIRVLGRYFRRDEAVRVVCKRCGHEWSPRPNELLRGNGCPRCCHVQTSFAEQFICGALKRVLGNSSKILSRDKSSVGCELDIYLPDWSLAIEFGSWYWHKDKLKRDAKKRALCGEAGIRLVTIYDAYPYGSPPFKEDCLVFSFDLASEEGHCSLKEIVSWILGQLGEGLFVPDDDWRLIELSAAEGSRMKTTERFINEIAEASPTVEVIGEYVNSNEKIECRCRECGNIWFAVPYVLQRGCRCKKCSAKAANASRKRSQSQFVSEVAEINSSIRVVGEFDGVSKKIEFECLECGNLWEAAPSKVLGGRGCPKCAIRKRASKQRKTHEDFLKELSEINSPVVVLGEYEGINVPVLCRCEKCQEVWSARPASLLRGSGCPGCAGRRRLTQEEYVQRIAQKNPDILVLGQYINAHTKIKVECRICGHAWNPSAGSILHMDIGCPECGKKKMIESRRARKTQGSSRNAGC